jgi:putative membrane protein
MYLPLILSFLMILGITIFALQNGVPLEVKFLVWGFKTSLIAVILGSVLIGAIIVSIFSLPLLIKKHFREKRLAKQVNELEKKSQELENQSQQKKASAFTSPTTTQLL